MDEKLKDGSKKVMLVEDAKDGNIKAVTDVDKDGSIKADPVQPGMSNLLDVNTNESGLEAFFKKFMEQAKEPSHTGVYILGKDTLDKILSGGKNLLEELNPFKAKPEEYVKQSQEQGQAFEPMDTTKINPDDLKKLGIDMKDLEPHLKAISYGHKSNQLIDMNPEMESGGMRIPTKGRVSLEETEEGGLRVIPHFRQDKPNLDAPLHGVLLDDKIKENLLKTGHAGEIVNLELTPGKKEPTYVTLDPLTNKLEVLALKDLKPLKEIKGIQLSEGQKLDFAAGRKVLIEGMKSRAGRLFDGYIQVNASDKKIDFTYDGIDRKRYAQENKEISRRQKAEGKEKIQAQSPGGENKPVFIPKVLLGTELQDKQRAALNNGNATYVTNMVDKMGEPFNAWVKPNYEEGKLDFFKWNPDKAKKQGAEVTPVAENKIQVAVNSDGKTNEATKDINEPHKQGQQQPTENQQQQQEEKQAKKSTQKTGGPKL